MTLAAAAPNRSFSDRLNPILVKEVRQALRGRYFKVMFWITLGSATLAGLLVVADAASKQSTEEIGQSFFVVMFACMSAAVHAFVPFSAYVSTSAEWDENTHDLLVLSNLGPRQIVVGKLLSALTQALLYYSTFGPFLVFAYLLNGIDLLTIGVLLACSLATCIGLSLAGIALASLTRVRAGRGLLMAAFGAALVMTWFGSIGAAVGVTESPQELRDPEGQIAVAAYVTFALLVGGLFAALAMARFAHEEENRSTGLRVLSTAIVLLAGGWGAGLHAHFGEQSTAWAMQVSAACLLALAWLHFLTEREGLGRRTTKHVPGNPALALLSIPFLPGGGRGVLLFFVHVGIALAGGLLALRTGVTHRGAATVAGMVSVFYAYVFVFLALPSGIGALLGKTDRARMITRIVAVLLVPLVILGPALLGLLLGIGDWMELRHPFNPVWVMEKLDNSSGRTEVLAALAMLALTVLVTLVFNVKRMLAGAAEVLAASRARRERALRTQL